MPTGPRSVGCHSRQEGWLQLDGMLLGSSLSQNSTCIQTLPSNLQHRIPGKGPCPTEVEREVHVLHAHHVPSCDVISRKCAGGATVLTDRPSPTSGNRRPQFVYYQPFKRQAQINFKSRPTQTGPPTLKRTARQPECLSNGKVTVVANLPVACACAHKMRELYAQRENKNKQTNTHTHTLTDTDTDTDRHR